MWTTENHSCYEIDGMFAALSGLEAFLGRGSVARYLWTNVRRCSNNRRAGGDSSPERRTQMCRRRRAQGSANLEILIAAILRHLRAAACGMMAIPMPLPTIRQRASKLPRRTRSLIEFPA